MNSAFVVPAVIAVVVLWTVVAVIVAIVLGRTAKRGEDAAVMATLGRDVRRADALADPNRAPEAPFTPGAGPHRSPLTNPSASIEDAA